MVWRAFRRALIQWQQMPIDDDEDELLAPKHVLVFKEEGAPWSYAPDDEVPSTLTLDESVWRNFLTDLAEASPEYESFFWRWMRARPRTMAGIVGSCLSVSLGLVLITGNTRYIVIFVLALPAALFISWLGTTCYADALYDVRKDIFYRKVLQNYRKPFADCGVRITLDLHHHSGDIETGKDTVVFFLIPSEAPSPAPL